MATLIVYPAAGTVSPVDGYVRNDDAGTAVWSTIRGATSGETADATATSFGIGFSIYSSGVANGYLQLGRGFLLFDTSSLPDDCTVDAAVLSTYGLSKFNDWTTIDASVHIAAANPASDAALVSNDFDNISRTSFGNIAYASLANSAYNDITFNASGLAAVNLTGLSRFSMQFGADLNDTAPTHELNKQLRYNARLADNTGTSQDPMLTITYTEAVTAINPGTGSTTGELKQVWLAHRIDGTVNKNIAQAERVYYAGIVGRDAPIKQLRIEWLQKTISDNGGTPVGNYESDLWKQLLATLGLPVSDSMSQNKHVFYQTATIA